MVLNESLKIKDETISASEKRPVVFNISIRADVLKEMVLSCIEEVNEKQNFSDVSENVIYRYLIFDFYCDNKIVSKVYANIEDYSILVDSALINHNVFNYFDLDWNSLWQVIENTFYQKNVPSVADRVKEFYSFHNRSEHIIFIKPKKRGRPSSKSKSKFNKIKIYYSE